MANREFVMLAQTLPLNADLAFWRLSEKLDGVRALWIPESRNCSLWVCPWANMDRKAETHTNRVCTGLWSRYGNIIEAPSWWLDMLPPFCVDGELYMGRGRFQDLTSVVKAWRSERDWKGVGYWVIDSPSYEEVFVPGQINNVNYKKYIEGVPSMLANVVNPVHDSRFDVRYANLKKANVSNDVVVIHHQESLDWRSGEAMQRVLAEVKAVTEAGGEGVVVRNGMTPWEAKRSATIYKVKPQLDSEAKVIGYTEGKGRLKGMAGALVCKWEGPAGSREFELAGLTDDERRKARTAFPIGTMVTFLYRELTNEGKPKEARYFRKRASL